MPTLLRPWKRPSREEPPGQLAQLEMTQEKRAAPAEPRDLFVLIPTDGGLSFRLFPFAGEEAAAAYVARLASPMNPRPRHIAFRALQSQPAERTGEPPEAVVLVRDAGRPGIVDLYSFVDMESAYQYVRGEEGLDLAHVLVYWAAPVELALADQPVPTRDVAPEPAPAPISFPRQAAVAARRAAPPYCPPEPAADTRVRIPVTPDGAVFEPAQPVATPEPAQPAEQPGLLAQVQAWRGWDGLAPLVLRASFLNERAFDEFEREPCAAGRGRLVLALAVLAAGIGGATSGPLSIAVHVPAFALGWVAYVFAVYSIGTQAFPGRRAEGTLPYLVRALGLATAPMLLLVLGTVPTYGPLFVLAAYMWLLLTTTVAVAAPLELNRDSCIIVATVGTLALFTVSQVAPLLIV